MHPLLRGMISYAVIWPTSSIAQQFVVNGSWLQHADLSRAARFSIFGAFFMAPVFYGWMRFSNKFFKGKTFKTAITRAAIEQVTYTPLALSYFFFGMSLLEQKPVATCCKEVQDKLLPTYKMNLLFWPAAQTVNFYFVKEKNRILFVSAASFVWTVYLAHMKAKEGSVSKNNLENK